MDIFVLQNKLLELQKLLNAITKLGRARILFNNYNCVWLKEESHIHLGWVEGE